MQLSSILSADRIALDVKIASKKRALELISELICANSPNLNPNEVFERLIAREKLGSTGLGKGVAIPHGRLKSGNSTIIAFLRLTNGIDYDAPDGEPVDLLCALMVPPESTDEHLQILARLSEIFRQSELRQALRKSETAEDVIELLNHSSGSH